MMPSKAETVPKQLSAVCQFLLCYYYNVYRCKFYNNNYSSLTASMNNHITCTGSLRGGVFT